MLIFKRCTHCGHSEKREVTNIPHSVARADYYWCVKCCVTPLSAAKDFAGFIGYFDADGTPLDGKGHKTFFNVTNAKEADGATPVKAHVKKLTLTPHIVLRDKDGEKLDEVEISPEASRKLMLGEINAETQKALDDLKARHGVTTNSDALKAALREARLVPSLADMLRDAGATIRPKCYNCGKSYGAHATQTRACPVPHAPGFDSVRRYCGPPPAPPETPETPDLTKPMCERVPAPSPVGNNGVIYRTRNGRAVHLGPKLMTDAEAVCAWYDKAMEYKDELDELQREFVNMRQDRDDAQALANSARDKLRQANQDGDVLRATIRDLEKQRDALQAVIIDAFGILERCKYK